jgi:hypothetical protein
MFGIKTIYRHEPFKKIQYDIHSFGKKSEHLHKFVKHNISDQKSTQSEPKKSQYEK